MRPIAALLGVVGTAAIAAVAGEGITSASTPGGPPVASTQRPDAVRGCRARTENARPFKFDKTRDMRVGRVVFRLARASHADLTRQSRGDYTLNVPIAVRTGEPVMLRIPSDARGRIALNYGNKRARAVDEGQDLVLVKPCSPRTRRVRDGRRIGRWTEFTGGFVFREPDCYPVEVSGSGKAYVRKAIGLGRRCGSGYAGDGPR